MARISREHLSMVLCALYRFCRSPHCHVPPEAVARVLPKHMRGVVARALRELERRGLVYRKGGTKSYGLTREGLEKAREWCTED